MKGSASLLFGCSSNNRNLLFVAALAAKVNNPVNQGIKGIILAKAYIFTGMDFCAVLSVKDVAGLNELTIGPLGAEAFGLGVTAVLGGADTLFMGEQLKIHLHHNRTPL